MKTVRSLLIVCALMMIVMVILGGATRLTGSGLSMVTWDPITGIFPPFSDAAWQTLFHQYQQYPEFKLINFSMTLNDFKGIFWLEFLHRLWGRLMALPLFCATLLIFKNHRTLLGFRIISVWILAGLQAAMGWYMVKSGLNQNPHVSPYRLTLHLLLAFGTFTVILTMIQDTWGRHRFKNGIVLGALILITVSLGGMVAGLKAGLLYNTFPFMGANLWPEEIHALINFWENPALVQFTHRVLGTLTLGGAWVWYSIQKSPAHLNLALIVSLQYCLGILTLIHNVPIYLGVLHQILALGVFGCFVWISRGPNTKSEI